MADPDVLAYLRDKRKRQDAQILATELTAVAKGGVDLVELNTFMKGEHGQELRDIAVTGDADALTAAVTRIEAQNIAHVSDGASVAPLPAGKSGGAEKTAGGQKK